MTEKLNLEKIDYSIKTLGYCKLENVLNKQLVENLSAGLDRIIDGDKECIKQYENYRFSDIAHQLLGREDVFTDVIENSLINSVVNRIISSTAIIHSFNANKLMPGRKNNTSKVHRDCPRFYKQDYPLMLQALILLDEFTLENGATYFLPASHHREDAPSDKYFYENAVRITGNPGDVIMFDSLVYHAGGDNNTIMPRRALTIVYSRSFMKQQIDLCKAIPKSKIDIMSANVRQRIGFDARVPSDLAEFMVPEKDRFYKANQG